MAIRIERCSVAAPARLAPAKPATCRYAAAKSEMPSHLRRESVYNSANTKRYVAEALAMSGVATGGPSVWLYQRDGDRERDATTDVTVHVVQKATGLAFGAVLRGR